MTLSHFLARVNGYCDQATKGPWEDECRKVCGPKGETLIQYCDLAGRDCETSHNDGYFIAQSRTDLPTALRLIEYLYEKARREKHHHCDEDTWFCCPKCTECNGHPDDRLRGKPCNCGLDTHNAKMESHIDLILKGEK